MKVWMWQRLYKRSGDDKVYAGLSALFEPFNFELTDEEIKSWHWLCPKPNLVLVDRKHLGGME